MYPTCSDFLTFCDKKTGNLSHIKVFGTTIYIKFVGWSLTTETILLCMYSNESFLKVQWLFSQRTNPANFNVCAMIVVCQSESLLEVVQLLWFFFFVKWKCTKASLTLQCNFCFLWLCNNWEQIDIPCHFRVRKKKKKSAAKVLKVHIFSCCSWTLNQNMLLCFHCFVGQVQFVKKGGSWNFCLPWVKTAHLETILSLEVGTSFQSKTVVHVTKQCWQNASNL